MTVVYEENRDFLPYEVGSKVERGRIPVEEKEHRRKAASGQENDFKPASEVETFRGWFEKSKTGQLINSEISQLRL